MQKRPQQEFLFVTMCGELDCYENVFRQQSLHGIGIQL